MAGTKTILLKNAQTTATVDEEEYERIVHMGRWFLGDGGYAMANVGGKKVRMHRVINNTPPEYITDHINGNRLDNRKANLRTVDHRENAQDAGYTGRKYELPKHISFDVSRGKYVATYKIRKRFDNLEDAIQFTKEGQ